MQLILANPAGWWALLGIPAVVLIHFLQHQARRLHVSTLFLLEHLGQESTEGRVFERVRNSASLWLQLLAVLLITWLLIEPRWVRPNSVQRVVVVLDSSASMSAFRERVEERLPRALRRLDRASATTEWRVIETDPGRGTLYAGQDLDALRARLGTWEPRLGTHDARPALRVAASLVGAAGTVVFVSDHEPGGLPPGVSWLGVGEPVANCGFTGLRLTRDAGAETWQTMVRNHGAVALERTWHVEAEGQPTEARTLRLEPGEARRLSGPFPPGLDAFHLVLSGDRFALDDRLPVIRPRPKRLALAWSVDESAEPFVERFIESLDRTDRVGRTQEPDLELRSYRKGILPGLDVNRICFQRPGAEPQTEGNGLVVAEEHSLVEGLSWQGLLCQATETIPDPDRADVLVWSGKHPIVYLRSGPEARQLVIAFDLAASNADRLPAFVIMLHRFAESVRADKRATAWENVEVHQVLDLAADEAGGDLVTRPEPRSGLAETVRPARQVRLHRAPAVPCLFEVEQDGEVIYRGGARFADLREADLGEAVSGDRLEAAVKEAAHTHSRPDPLGPVWILLAAAALLGSWAASGRSRFTARGEAKGTVRA